MAHERGKVETYPTWGNPWFSRPRVRIIGVIAYSERVNVPFRNRPYSWISGAHNPRTNIEGEIELYLFLAKKVKNGLKSGSPRLRSKEPK